MQTRQEEEHKVEPGVAGGTRPHHRLYGYWCSTGYSEVEPFIRGNIKITLIDDIKADRLVHKDEALNCLSLLMEQKDVVWPRQALTIIANLAATGIPSLAYELVVKWRVQDLVYTTVERHPEVLDVSCCALVGLFASGRSATRRALLSDELFMRRIVEASLAPVPAEAQQYGIMGLWEATREIEPSSLPQALESALEKNDAGYTELSRSLLKALDPNVTRDVHVLSATSNLLMELVSKCPKFLEEFKALEFSLAGMAEKLMIHPEVSLSCGKMLSFLLTELGLQKDHSCFIRIVNAVPQTSLLREMGPFSLLKCDHWSPETFQRILEASRESILAYATEEELFEVLVRESVLERYVELLDRFASSPGQAGGGKIVTGVLQCIAVAYDAAASVRDVIMDEEMVERLRSLLRAFKQDAGVLESIFILFERVSRPSTLPGMCDSRQPLLIEASLLHKLTDANVVLLTGHGERASGVLTDDMVEVSSGSRSKNHLTDGRQNSYWESSSRVRFDGQVRGVRPDGTVEVMGRPGGPGSHGVSPVEGHWMTVKLPPPSEWEKLQLFRGNMESYTPEDIAVLAIPSDSDPIFLERHYMNSRTSSSYETILQKRDLLETLERVGVPVEDVVIRIEVYRMLQNGHNTRICGLRLVGTGRRFEGLDGDTIWQTFR